MRIRSNHWINRQRDMVNGVQSCELDLTVPVILFIQTQTSSESALPFTAPTEPTGRAHAAALLVDAALYPLRYEPTNRPAQPTCSDGCRIQGSFDVSQSDPPQFEMRRIPYENPGSFADCRPAGAAPLRRAGRRRPFHQPKRPSGRAPAAAGRSESGARGETPRKAAGRTLSGASLRPGG